MGGAFGSRQPARARLVPPSNTDTTPDKGGQGQSTYAIAKATERADGIYPSQTNRWTQGGEDCMPYMLKHVSMH